MSTIAAVPAAAVVMSIEKPCAGSRSCSGPTGPTGDTASMVRSAVPIATAAITADVARSTSRSCDRTIPMVRNVSLSTLLRSRLRWTTCQAATVVAPKARSPSAATHDDEGPQRFVDRVRLLAARRLQLVAEHTDRRRQIPSSIEARRQVDVADRVRRQVAMGLVEGTREHDDAGGPRFVADRLDRQRADARRCVTVVAAESGGSQARTAGT